MKKSEEELQQLRIDELNDVIRMLSGELKWCKKDLSDCAKQNQILRDTLKTAKDLVSDMILAVHMPGKMAGWTEISARALKLLEGETNGKKESDKEENNKGHKEI